MIASSHPQATQRLLLTFIALFKAQLNRLLVPISISGHYSSSLQKKTFVSNLNLPHTFPPTP